MDAVVETPFGRRVVEAVGAGEKGSAVAASRKVSIAADEVVVSVGESTVTAGYAAKNCG